MILNCLLAMRTTVAMIISGWKAIFPARSKPDGLYIGQVKDSGQIRKHMSNQ